MSMSIICVSFIDFIELIIDLLFLLLVLFFYPTYYLFTRGVSFYLFLFNEKTKCMGFKQNWNMMKHKR